MNREDAINRAGEMYQAWAREIYKTWGASKDRFRAIIAAELLTVDKQAREETARGCKSPCPSCAAKNAEIADLRAKLQAAEKVVELARGVAGYQWQTDISTRTTYDSYHAERMDWMDALRKELSRRKP